MRVFRSDSEKTTDLLPPGQTHQVFTDTQMADIDIILAVKEISKVAKIFLRCGGRAQLAQATTEIFLRGRHSMPSQTMECVS